MNTKLVIVGDGDVGKTCLLKTFLGHQFQHNSVPTHFDNYVGNIKVGDKQVGHQRPAVADLLEATEHIALRSYTVFICLFDSFSAQVRAHTGSPIEARRFMFSVLLQMYALVILTFKLCDLDGDIQSKNSEIFLFLTLESR